jgi:anthranilate phosphoribosyltransferase
MSDLAQVIRYLCSPSRDEGDAIDASLMRGAFAAVLDGGASDIELGALVAAVAVVQEQRDARRYAEVLLAMAEAVRERTTRIGGPVSARAVVVMPNYGCSGQGNAIPLLAFKLCSFGIPVLVHGALETSTGLANCGVFREFGVLPNTTRAQAERNLIERGLALVPLSLVSPGLAAMMSLKNHIGVQTPAHVLAGLLIPVLKSASRSLHVFNVPSWLELCAEDIASHPDSSVLLVGGEQEGWGCIANRPRMRFRREDATGPWETLFTSEALPRGEALRQSGELPVSVSALAAWTRARLDGKAILPVPVVNQLAACLYGSGYAEDFNQAKAIAAVETGLAAA